jgi:hypothetical protein
MPRLIRGYRRPGPSMGGSPTVRSTASPTVAMPHLQKRQPVEPSALAKRILRSRTSENAQDDCRKSILQAATIGDVYVPRRGENLPDDPSTSPPPGRSPTEHKAHRIKKLETAANASPNDTCPCSHSRLRSGRTTRTAIENARATSLRVATDISRSARAATKAPVAPLAGTGNQLVHLRNLDFRARPTTVTVQRVSRLPLSPDDCVRGKIRQLIHYGRGSQRSVRTDMERCRST